MRIEDRLIGLATEFKNQHDKFLSLGMQAKSVEDKYDALSKEIKMKYEQKKRAKEQLKETIYKYYRIAKENTSNEIRANDVALIPDIAKINNLVNEIDITKDDDLKAREVVSLVSKYISYVNREISMLAGEEKAEQRKNDELKATAMNRMYAERQKLLDGCKKYLSSDNVLTLVQLLGLIEKEYEIGANYFANWKPATKKVDTMLYGYRKYHVDCPAFLLDDMSRIFGKHFDKSRSLIDFPCGYDMGKTNVFDIEYTDKTAGEVADGIKSWILNLLKYYKPSELRVTLIDQIHYSPGILGKLSALITAKNSLISKVPYDENDLRLEIAKLANYYRDVENLIGYSTVREYNTKKENVKKIPERLFIINRNDQVSTGYEKAELMYILNNAEKFGITVIIMTRKRDIEQKTRNSINLPNTKFIKTDANGNLYIFDNGNWIAFSINKLSCDIPADFIQKILKETTPVEIGTKYPKRFQITTPKKSIGKHKDITIPFAVDNNDKAVYCNFDNENFAAFMMGSSRSGKSTLLHVMISHLVMNYHPDELELWLVDLKMNEFSLYANVCPPHLKYLLLEKSPDLVYDLLDKLTEELEKRKIVFSRNDWKKITDVPINVYMPVIFVIIDEFAQMSQIIKNDNGRGYAGVLENLLRQGGGYGFKFIFADQTYTTGVEGLTDPAREQIQLRFALYNNNRSEIRHTLYLSDNQITTQVDEWISTMPVYHTLFKWRDEKQKIHVDLLRNMYIESDAKGSNKYISEVINTVNSKIKAVPYGTVTTDNTYIYRMPVCINGSHPRTIQSLSQAYAEYESRLKGNGYFPEDTLIYQGVPCSFNLVKPFLLKNTSSENIFIIKDRAGKLGYQMSVLLSILKSFMRNSGEIEVWAHYRSGLYAEYGSLLSKKCTVITDLLGICRRAEAIKNDILSGKKSNKMVVVLGYEYICDELENLSLLQSYANKNTNQSVVDSDDDFPKTAGELKKLVDNTPDKNEKARIIAKFNQYVNNYNNKQGENINNSPKVPSTSLSDIKDTIKLLLRIAPQFGVHFTFCFEDTSGFIKLRMPENDIIHKIYMAIAPVEARAIGMKNAGTLREGTSLYFNGAEEVTFRPHIHYEVPYPKWKISSTGEVVEDFK